MTAGRAPNEIETLVNKRIGRQGILVGDAAPRIVAIFDEMVIRRMIGGPEDMKEQITRVMEIAEMPNVTLHVVPTGRRAHAGLSGSFTMLRTVGAPEMVYTEGYVGGTITDHPPTVETFRLSFDLIRGAAMSADDSLELLRTALEGL
ncbi:hypothetical protein GCM10027589_07790 [Actinocorallia lasiicapitis]